MHQMPILDAPDVPRDALEAPRDAPDAFRDAPDALRTQGETTCRYS